MLTRTDVSRREFLVLGGGAMMTVLAAPQPRPALGQAVTAGPRVIYRLSLRGRRGSNAAKRHNANMRFASADVAASHRAHPGDHSRVVPLTVSAATFRRLFPSPDSVLADLRKVAPECPGDCSGDGLVSVGELVTGVNVALGSTAVSTCRPADSNRDTQVTIDELTTAVNGALNGCPS